MKKILFAATVDSHILAFHVPYLKYFKEQGYEIHVATNGNKEIPYCDKKYTISFERKPLKFSNVKAIVMLKKVVEKEKYDIIHCHTPMGGVVTRIAAIRIRRQYGTKIIYTAHGFHFFKGAPLKNWLVYYPIEKWLSRYTDILITINKEDYDKANDNFYMKELAYVPGVGVDIDKIKKVLPNRKSLLKELNLDDEKILMLSVGELSSRKNHQIIIQCLPKLSENICYLIVGKGNKMEKLRSLAKKLGVIDRVHFLGFRSDIFEIMKSCDFFIFPSLQEGLPVALMEAMACGLPCIVSKIRGNIDLIENGKYGLFCESTKVDEFATTISMVSDDSQLRSEIGKYNENIIKRYDIKEVMKQFETLYKD